MNSYKKYASEAYVDEQIDNCTQYVDERIENHTHDEYASIEYVDEKIASGGVGGGVTQEYVDEQIENINEQIQNIVYSDEIDDDIASAPMNADTLGGRPADEYALNSELQNYALNSELQNYALSSELTLQIDIVNEKIPTTAEQVGAAPTTHEHSAENITSGVLPPIYGGTGCTSIVDTTYTTARYRASSLHSTETTPTTNGVIAWTYE